MLKQPGCESKVRKSTVQNKKPERWTITRCKTLQSVLQNNVTKRLNHFASNQEIISKMAANGGHHINLSSRLNWIHKVNMATVCKMISENQKWTCVFVRAVTNESPKFLDSKYRHFVRNSHSTHKLVSPECSTSRNGKL